MLRLFGAPLWTVQQAAQQADIAARCRGRGAEVLAALQAETPAGLEKARKALNGRFAAELYGEGEMTLVHAAVQALETHRRLLVCCDADAGTLLEARLETVPGAEKVFDFGALSYADAGGGDKLAKIRQGGPGGCADGADPSGQAGKHRSGKAVPQTAQGAECPDFSADSGTGRVCRCVVLHRRRPRRPAPEVAEPWRR